MSGRYSIGWFRDPLTDQVYEVVRLGVRSNWFITPYEQKGDRHPSGAGNLLTMARWKRLEMLGPVCK